jgi:hypothetical protein
MKNGGQQKFGFSNPLTKHSLKHSKICSFHSNWSSTAQLSCKVASNNVSIGMSSCEHMENNGSIITSLQTRSWPISLGTNNVGASWFASVWLTHVRGNGNQRTN